MIPKMKWVDRKFEFNFSTGVFPCIVERLRGAPVRVEEIVRNLPTEILTKCSGNLWSIQEHVGHLADLDELHDGRIDDFLAKAEVLRAADMKNLKTEAAKHNEQNIETLLSAFRSARMKFVERLETLDEEIVARTALHPRLKIPMRPIDMAYFTAEHDDHHIASIVELGRGLSN